MDRLQVALNKARAKREANMRGGQEAGPPQAQDPAQAPAQEPAPPGPAAGDRSGAWNIIAPLNINEKALVRNRLVSFAGGKEAGPFDMLRTKMLQQAKSHGWRRIAIVSPHSGCGKSTTAGNLAFSFSRQQDLRTLVLDFDLRRKGLAELLAQRGQDSMGDVLERRVAFQSHALRLGDNIAFGLNFGPVTNPSEILQSQQAAEVLAGIEDTYKPDIMLFDTPPLMASDDSHGFLETMDCALLLVAAEQTTMDEIDVAERQLAGLTNVMGIVLNKCRYTNGAHGYEYDYY